MPDRAVPARVALFTEVGGAIGYGHWVRCSALAAALQAAGAEVAWVLHVEGDPAIALPSDAHRVSWQADPRAALQAVGPADLVLVDSYRADHTAYARLAAETRLVVLDDYDRLRYPAGLLINPNPAADEISYAAQAADVVGGAEWVMLRPAIVEARAAAQADPRSVPAAVGSIVLTLGGSDVHRLAVPFVRCLGATYPEAAVHVVAGSKAYAAELRAHLPAVTVHGYLEAASFAARLVASDLAVSAAGQTLHELACLGVSTVAVGTGMDQLPNLRSYVRRGLLGGLITWQQPDLMERLAAGLRALAPADRRRARSEQLRAFIDGRGAARVARRLLAWASA